jgi:hypothetical protein
MSSEEQEIISWVTSHQPDYQADASAWLAMTGSVGGSLQDAIRQHLTQRGLFPTTLDAAHAVLYAEEQGSSPITLLLYYHYDARADDAATLLPFLASLAIHDLYQSQNRPLPITIQWLIDGSGPGKFFPDPGEIPSLSADYILWLAVHQATEAAPTLALGYKGYLSVSLSTATAATSLASSYGAIVPNPAWRLLWALNHLKDVNEYILIEGFYDKLVPADDQLTEILYTLPETLPEYADQPPPFLLQLHGFQLHYAHLLLPTCSIISFESQPSEHTQMGHSLPLLPSQAQAQVDFYLVPDQDPANIFAKIQEHLQNQGFSDLKLQWRTASYPSSLAPTHPFVTILQQAISDAQITGGLPVPGILPLVAENFSFAHTSQMPPLVVYTMGRMTTARDRYILNTENYTNAIKQLFFLIERLKR